MAAKAKAKDSLEEKVAKEQSFVIAVGTKDICKRIAKSPTRTSSRTTAPYARNGATKQQTANTNREPKVDK